MRPEKSLQTSTLMDDLVSLVDHQRKRCNHSSTFNTLNNDHYLLTLNSHQCHCSCLRDCSKSVSYKLTYEMRLASVVQNFFFFFSLLVDSNSYQVSCFVSFRCIFGVVNILYLLHLCFFWLTKFNFIYISAYITMLL